MVGGRDAGEHVGLRQLGQGLAGDEGVHLATGSNVVLVPGHGPSDEHRVTVDLLEAADEVGDVFDGEVRPVVAVGKDVAPVVGVAFLRPLAHQDRQRRVEIFDCLLLCLEVPIFTEIREGGDRGTPITVSAPNHLAGKAFIQIAEAIRRGLK